MGDLGESYVKNELKGERKVWKAVRSLVSRCSHLEGPPPPQQMAGENNYCRLLVWVETKCFSVDTLPDTVGPPTHMKLQSVLLRHHYDMSGRKPTSLTG